ncbi:hypothetical protein GIB67_013201 [Kingdonia uniflora]|uniref:Cytochrome c biogenesis FC n=1 Tax=Kingdonia uniflora TaxID=39325 RepID=A0A7J7NQM8_9MAGN|nr:hypothetical protein GIB67_013201 [Kingdonia uniflora]
MIQLQNFFLFITSMVVPRGTAAPILLKWFVSRDVPTGAPFFNGTIIPIPIPSFLLLVFLHSRKFIGSTLTDRALPYIGVKAQGLFKQLFLSRLKKRRSSEGSLKKVLKKVVRARNAVFPFVILLHFLLLMEAGDFSTNESFCGVLSLLFCRTLFSAGENKRVGVKRRPGACSYKWPKGNEQGQNGETRWGMVRHDKDPHNERGVAPYYAYMLQANLPVKNTYLLARPVHLAAAHQGKANEMGGRREPFKGLANAFLQRQPMALGHDYLQHTPKPLKSHIHLSHSGVCIFMLGVLLSCDPAAAY